MIRTYTYYTCCGYWDKHIGGHFKAKVKASCETRLDHQTDQGPTLLPITRIFDWQPTDTFLNFSEGRDPQWTEGPWFESGMRGLSL